MQLLKYASFRYFFISEIFYCFAIGMGTVGANWVIMDVTGSSTLVGLLLTVNVLAGFFVSPIIGTFTDRTNRKILLMALYTFQIVSLFLLIFFILNFGITIFIIFLFAVINGIGWTAYMSTSRALMQEFLDESLYLKGNSIIEISLQVGMFTAGAAAGILYEKIGFQGLLLLNMFAIIISLTALAFLKYKPKAIETQLNTFLKDIKNGFIYLGKEKVLFYFGIASILPSVATMLFNVILPGYIINIIQEGSIIYGISDMAYGVGGFLSGIFAAIIIKYISERILLPLTFSLIMSFLLILSIQNSTIILIIICFFFGFGNSSIRIWMNTRIMEYVPSQFIGRAIATWTAFSLLLQAVLSVCLGSFMDQTSESIGFLILTCLMGTGFIIVLKNNLITQISQSQLDN
jgi:MFS family permease